MRAGGWLFAAALMLLPVAFDNFELPKQLVLALACVVFAARAQVPWSAPDVRLLSGWMLVALFAAAFSQAPLLSVSGVEGSRGGLVSVVLFAGWYLFARSSAGSVAGAACLVVWPIALWAWLQYFGRDPIPWVAEASWCGAMRPFATLGHPAHLGVFTALVIPLALERAWRGQGRGWALATALLAASACAISLSRAGWLAALVGVAVWSARSGARKYVLGAVAMAAAGLAVVRPEALMLRLKDALVAPTRVALWNSAVDAFLAHPVSGVGLDAFQLASQQFRTPDAWLYEWGTTPQHAHSLIGQVMATMGVAGVAMTGVTLAVIVSVLVRRKPTAPVAVLAAGGVSWLVTFHSAATLALLLACAAELAREEWPPASTPARFSWLRVALVGLLVVAFPLRWTVASVCARQGHFELAARFEPESALWPAQQGAQLEARGDWSGAREAYATAVRRAPRFAIYLADLGRVAAAQGDEAATSLFADAIALDPLDAHVLHQAALAELKLAHPAAARALLDRLLTRYPSYGPAWWTLAELDVGERRLAEARAMLQSALQADWRDWPRGRDIAQSRLAQVLAVQGELDQAMEVYRAPPVHTDNDACGSPKRIALAGETDRR
ncbi:MAG: O-antigen ligase family protein [Myxococcaceae bacterium]